MKMVAGKRMKEGKKVKREEPKIRGMRTGLQSVVRRGELLW